VVGLAHSLDMRVVAEGVDADAQAEVLRRIGCDELQGFSICESVRLEELLEMLEQGAFGRKTPLGVIALQSVPQSERAPRPGDPDARTEARSEGGEGKEERREGEEGKNDGGEEQGT
jgi:hypothetical protein